MFGRIGAFLTGAVAGMGISEFYGPFFTSGAKRDLQRTGRSAQRGAENLYDEAKDKYQDVKKAAKEKYEDVKDDIKK